MHAHTTLDVSASKQNVIHASQCHMTSVGQVVEQEGGTGGGPVRGIG